MDAEIRNMEMKKFTIWILEKRVTSVEYYSLVTRHLILSLLIALKSKLRE